MVFEVNGLNFVPFIGEDGIKWTWQGVDGPKTGRNLNALMDRDLIGLKGRCDVTLLWVKKDDIVAINEAIQPKFVTVRTDTCPWKTGVQTFEMYSNNVSATLEEEYTDGTQIFDDMSFPLIER